MKPSLLLGIEHFKLTHKLGFVCVVTACMWWLALGRVTAQETTPAVPPATEASPIGGAAPTTEIQVQPPLNAEIAEQRTKYRAELENYRSLDRQAAIAAQQYAQLKTLVSLETAVSLLKKTMESRVKVLDLYYTLLRMELTNATGVEITAKNRLLAQLDEVLIQLAMHQEKVAAANDRDSLNAVSAEFGEQKEVLETLANLTQAQLTLSRLQTVYDKAQVTKQEVKDQTASQTAVLQQPVRERAFAETDRNLENVRTQLQSLQQELDAKDSFLRATLTSFLQKSDGAYSGLAQTINFLSELAGL